MADPNTSPQDGQLLNTPNDTVAPAHTTPDKKFDGLKMLWVLLTLVIVVGGSLVIGLRFDAEKPLVYAGLIVAVVGQLIESVMKTTEVEAKPRMKDAFELISEGFKFYGVLAALFGVALGIDV